MLNHGGIVVGSAVSSDIIQMVMHAGFVVRFVLLTLVLFSVISWAIIFLKFRQFSKAKKETSEFMDLFWERKSMQDIYEAADNMEYSPVACVFRSGYTEFRRIQKLTDLADAEGLSEKQDSVISKQPVMANLERSLKKAIIDQTDRLERGTGFLATTGNTAPFIGLFGTVWGIMESFRTIGLKGSASLAVVAPGISEALIATAAGLATAIPAVVAYNYFTGGIAGIRTEMDIFASDMLSAVERELFRPSK